MKAHDQDAWKRLVRLYGPLVDYWIRRSRLQTADAQDVFQEVFRTVAANIGIFRKEHPSDSFRGWLRVITRSKVADHFRRRGSQPQGVGGSDFQRHLREMPEPDDDVAEVDGIDLARLVRKHGPLPVSDACRYGEQVALALQHAHEHGLVHRDVKPSNLMLDRRGKVKLLDLGLARLRPVGDDVGDMTETGQVLGTADFMAPEQAADPRLSDPRSDVYSLGCTLFFLLTGKPPFAAAECDTPMKRILAHSQQPVPSLRARRPDVQPQLDQLVARMMAKRPEDRPSEAGQTASALADLAVESDRAGVGRQLSPPRLLDRRSVITAVALLALISAGLWALRERNVKSPARDTVVPASAPLSSDVDHRSAAPMTAQDEQRRQSPPSPATSTTLTIARRPRPSSWAAGRAPTPRLTDTGVGVWGAARNDSFSSWLIIGPFLYDGAAEAFDAVHPIEHDWVSPGERFTTPEGNRDWMSCEYLALYDLAEATGTSIPRGRAGVYYAACWAKFPSGHRELGWELFTKCAWKFWIDGKLVKESREPGFGKGAGLQRVLDEGWNELLVKLIVPAKHSSDFSPGISFQTIRRPDPAGRPDDELLPHFMNQPPE